MFEMASRVREDARILTRREIECLRLRVTGLKSQQVADTLKVSKRTVDGHCRSVFLKLDAHNIVQAMRRAVELGIIEPPV